MMEVNLSEDVKNNIQQIRTFIAKRLIYMDECVNAIHQAVPCTNITLNKTELQIIL